MRRELFACEIPEGAQQPFMQRAMTDVSIWRYRHVQSVPTMIPLEQCSTALVIMFRISGRILIWGI